MRSLVALFAALGRRRFVAEILRHAVGGMADGRDRLLQLQFGAAVLLAPVLHFPGIREIDDLGIKRPAFLCNFSHNGNSSGKGAPLYAASGARCDSAHTIRLACPMIAGLWIRIMTGTG